MQKLKVFIQIVFVYSLFSPQVKGTDSPQDLSNSNVQKIAQAQEFEIILSNEEPIKKEIFKLRYKMMHELFPLELQYKEVPTENHQETDDYDAHSKFCAVKREGKIVGTGRIILGRKEAPENSFIVQHYTQYFHNDFSYKNIPIENIAEFSRLYVLPEYRGLGGFLSIFKGRLRLCSELGISYFFVRAEIELVKKYKTYGLIYRQVSDPFKDKDGALIAIYFNEIQSFLDTLNKTNSDLWSFVTENGKVFPKRTLI